MSWNLTLWRNVSVWVSKQYECPLRGGKSDKGNRLEYSESQRLETLAGINGLLALVQTTRLTGGCDSSPFLCCQCAAIRIEWGGGIHPFVRTVFCVTGFCKESVNSVDFDGLKEYNASHTIHRKRSKWRIYMIDHTQFKAASLIVKLGNAVTYYRNSKMEDIDLTSQQSDALIETLRNPGITASQLKEHMGISQSTMAGILSRLETKGLVRKTMDEEDARKAMIAPSEQGLMLEEPLKEIALDTHKALVDGMNEMEQTEFIRLLGIALDNMNKIRA